MTSEHDYRNAVRYLQNLLNGGLMGARGTSPLTLTMTAALSVVSGLIIVSKGA